MLDDFLLALEAGACPTLASWPLSGTRNFVTVLPSGHHLESTTWVDHHDPFGQSGRVESRVALHPPFFLGLFVRGDRTFESDFSAWRSLGVRNLLETIGKPSLGDLPFLHGNAAVFDLSLLHSAGSRATELDRSSGAADVLFGVVALGATQARGRWLG